MPAREASAALPMPEPVLPGTTPIGVPATPALNIGRCSPPTRQLVAPIGIRCQPAQWLHVRVAALKSIFATQAWPHEPECSDAGACTDGHASDDSSTTAGEASQASLERADRACEEGAAAHVIGTSAAGVGPASGAGCKPNPPWDRLAQHMHPIASRTSVAMNFRCTVVTPRDDDEQRGDGDRVPTEEHRRRSRLGQCKILARRSLSLPSRASDATSVPLILAHLRIC